MSTSKKLIFISQLFDPEYSIKGLDLIKELREQGFEVEVITGVPNYPKGEIFPGYKNKLWQTEVMDGVVVKRFWTFISPKKTKLRRALNYVSFFIVSTMYLLFRKSPDLIYAYHPQITTGITGILLKKIRGIKFITDVQDLWPESLISDGLDKRSWLARGMNRLSTRIFSNAEAILVLSKGFKSSIEDRGISAEKIHVVYNWCGEEARYLNLPQPPVQQRVRPMQFFYTGNHGPLQQLEVVIEAFSRFSPDQATLTLVGAGSEKQKLESLIEQRQILNVKSLSFIPPAELAVMLEQADVLVCHLKDDPLFKITIPSKTQAYLCSAKPILMAVGGEANAIVKDAGAGVIAAPGDVDSIERAIQQFLLKKDELSEMGDAGRRYYNANLSSARATKNIIRILEASI